MNGQSKSLAKERTKKPKGHYRIAKGTTIKARKQEIHGPRGNLEDGEGVVMEGVQERSPTRSLDPTKKIGGTVRRVKRIGRREKKATWLFVQVKDRRAKQLRGTKRSEFRSVDSKSVRGRP